MRYREGGSLDTSSVQDRRGLGGGDGEAGSAVGGLRGLGQGEQADNSALEQACDDSGDANTSVDCAMVANIESIQDFWGTALGADYVPTQTVFFSGQVQTSWPTTRASASWW